MLIDVVIWESAEDEPFDVVSASGDLLNSFLRWRFQNLDNLLDHDNGILLTGIDFDGSTVGLAPMGTLCQETNSGIIIRQRDLGEIKRAKLKNTYYLEAKNL